MHIRTLLFQIRTKYTILRSTARSYKMHAVFIVATMVFILNVPNTSQCHHSYTTIKNI